MTMYERTGVAGCAIEYEKNHEGRWCLFLRVNMSEMSDGLRADESILLAEALKRGATRLAEMNMNEKSKMLFEG
ncbi:MAG: hypothetical protein ACO3QV_02165 [Candidatus Nanopelagicaceae bacterium]